MKSLAVIGSEPPCFACPAPCCSSYVVPITAFDLWRMARTLELPWQEVAEPGPGKAEEFDCFRLDDSERRHGFYLLRKPSGACRFLVELPDGPSRCGAHLGRPLACRTYPFKTVLTGDGLDFISHTLCPPRERALFEAARERFRPAVVDEMEERMLHVRAVHRWDQMAARLPPRMLDARDYASWAFQIYDAIARVRVGARATWQPEAERIIDAWPLPDATFTDGL
jgi:Fe-S-cluster containining protein